MGDHPGFLVTNPCHKYTHVLKSPQYHKAIMKSAVEALTTVNKKKPYNNNKNTSEKFEFVAVVIIIKYILYYYYSIYYRYTI